MEQDSLALPAFVLSIIGVVIASLAAATGVWSLVWQIRTRTRGAHRVRVAANSNMRLFDPDSGNADDEDYIQIRVRNSGLTAVAIQNWAISFPDGNRLMIFNPLPYPPQPPLPHLLSPGTSTSFYSRARDLLEALDGRNLKQARVVVYLATGEEVRSRRGQISID